MSQAPSERWKPVRLAAKVIGHVSQGMYRTPAGAIKELVSNAYDAGATYIKIHTGFPTFGEFTCEDDGSGIHPNEFTRLMMGGIGDSKKQSSRESRVGRFDRPIIGRLGVGLLSLAQICSEFKIVSYHKASRKAFAASIRFPAYTRKDVDSAIKKAAKSGEKFIETGQYSLKPIKYVEGQTGVTITTTFVREAFRKTMGNLAHFGNLRFNKTNRSYAHFGEFLDSISNPELSALFFLSPYDQFLFGLGLAAPLPYPETDGQTRSTCVLSVPGVVKLQKTLKSYNFSLEVDNVSFRRPVVLPSNKLGTRTDQCELSGSPVSETFKLVDGPHESEQKVLKYVVKVDNSDEKYQLLWLSYEARVNGYPMKFSGYVFNQTTRLFPKEYQGILVRLRNIAIGQYDPNFLVYPQAEGPRFSMVSSEIFVEEGLDDSLKVDRDGFNTLDPQYIRLQAYIHGLLHDIVFPSIWEEEKPRNERRRAARRRSNMKRFAKNVSRITKTKIKKVKVVSGSTAEDENVAEVDTRSGTVFINSDKAESSGVFGRKKFNGIAQQVIAAFEIAVCEPTVEKRREVFYQLLRGVFE